jgi:hypothetical protein
MNDTYTTLNISCIVTLPKGAELLQDGNSYGLDGKTYSLGYITFLAEDQTPSVLEIDDCEQSQLEVATNNYGEPDWSDFWMNVCK